MNKIGLYIIVVLLGLWIVSCQSSKSWKQEVIASLRNDTITQQSECVLSEDNYWYNDICWNYASAIMEGGMSEEDISAYLQSYQQALSKSYVKIGEMQYPVVELFFYEDSEEQVFTIFIMFEVDGIIQSIVAPVSFDSLSDTSNPDSLLPIYVTYIDGTPFEDIESEDVILSSGEVNASLLPFYFNVEESDAADELYIFAEGMLETGETLEWKVWNEVAGGGNVTLIVDGDTAILSGTLGTQAYMELNALQQNNSEMTTLVLDDILGSVNDAINLHTARIVRNAGWNTYVPSHSEIDSGGVDLFASGVERIAEKGANIGVHSWCCFMGLDAVDLPKTHPAHKYQLDYFSTMLGNALGPQFYFFTLEKAPFDDIHIMTEQELETYDLVTQWVE